MRMAGALRRVHNDGQMTDAMHFRHNRQRQGVATVGFKRANTAFAENDVAVAALHDILRREHELFQRGA